METGSVIEGAPTAPDTMLQMMVYWKIKDMSAFLKGCADFVELTKQEAGNTHYGFTIMGDEAVCKEAYTGAEGFLAHLQNVDGPLQAALQSAEITKIEAHGPKAEVDKLRVPLKDFPVTYWHHVDAPFLVPAKYTSSDPTAPDTTLSMMVHWKVKDMAAFLRGCADFAELTKQETGNKYYGFTVSGDQAVCKEGYTGAEGFLAHLENVEGPLAKALQVADITKIEAHGPKAEVDKLRDPLQAFPVTYWSYVDGAFFVPSKYTGLEPKAEATEETKEESKAEEPTAEAKEETKEELKTEEPKAEA
jgi:quinol monooxygenase YgiN